MRILSLILLRGLQQFMTLCKESLGPVAVMSSEQLKEKKACKIGVLLDTNHTERQKGSSKYSQLRLLLLFKMVVMISTFFSFSSRSHGKTLHTRIEHSNGRCCFPKQPDVDGQLTVLIEHSTRDSENGTFCFSRFWLPGSAIYHVRMTNPVAQCPQIYFLRYLGPLFCISTPGETYCNKRPTFSHRTPSKKNKRRLIYRSSSAER